jgi:hypothetical protein
LLATTILLQPTEITQFICGQPLSVDLTDALIARDFIVIDDGTAAITTAGARFFNEFGITLPARRSARRAVCRLCLDWTERRPHIAGPLLLLLPSAFSISDGSKG